MLEFSIQHLTIRTILTQYQKVKDQIDTFKMSKTKLKNSLKDKDQICHLLKNFLWSKYPLSMLIVKVFFFFFLMGLIFFFFENKRHYETFY